MSHSELEIDDFDDFEEFDPCELAGVEMDYSRAFQFITESPAWLQNILLLGVCQLIPVLGPIVTIGYQFEVAESLLRGPARRGYADFDFNKFTTYLVRGFWPCMASLIIGLLVAIPVTFICMGFVVVFVLGTAAGGGAAVAPGRPEFALLAFASLAVVIVILNLLIQVAVVPMTLRAGYGQDLGEAFNFGFVRDFIEKMWLETICSMCLLAAIAIPMMVLGLLLCGIGTYFCAAAVFLVQAHLMDFQLYRVYLGRGGEQIPLKSLQGE